jgi:transporter family-2 protein
MLMKYSLSALTGSLIAIMILMNGILAGVIGNEASTIVIHISGLVAVTVLLLVRRQPVHWRKAPYYLYCAGIIGFLTVIFTNYSFARLGVSVPLALGLLGQSVTSILIDNFGWLGMKKRPFQKKKLFGMLLTSLGIIFMMVW